VLRGSIAVRERELFRQDCVARKIILSLSCPLNITPSKILQYLKDVHQDY